MIPESARSIVAYAGILVVVGVFVFWYLQRYWPRKEGWLRRLWPLLAFGVAMVLFVTCTQESLGQTHRPLSFEAELEGGVDLWGNAERDYQHVWYSNGEARLSWRFIEASGYLKRRMWYTDKTQIPGSPLNAEGAKTRQFVYGGKLLFRPVRHLYFGPHVHRDQFFHLIQRNERHGYFPAGWREAVETARTGDSPNWPDDKPQKASIAYHDEAGLSAEVRFSTFEVRASWLFYRWKDLTSIPVNWQFQAEYTPDHWFAGVQVERDLLQRWTYDVKVTRKVSGKLFGYQFDTPVWFGLVGSTNLRTPDWDTPITRIATTVSLRLSDPL